MEKSFRASVGQLIVSHDDAEPLALLRDVILNPDTGKIGGWWVKPITLPLSLGILLPEDILSWKKSIYITSENVIADPSDLVRLEEMLQRNVALLGKKVYSETGRYLGKVLDFSFDPNLSVLRSIYVRRGFWLWTLSQRVFGMESIIEIQSDRIIVKDLTTEKVAESEGDLMKEAGAV